MSPQTSKQAVKEASQYFSLLCKFCCKRSLFPFSSGPYIFLSILLLLMYLKKPFFLALISFTRFNSKWALTFLIASCKGGDPAKVNEGLLGHAQNYFSGNAGGRNLFSLALLMKKIVHIDRKTFSPGNYCLENLYMESQQFRTATVAEQLWANIGFSSQWNCHYHQDTQLYFWSAGMQICFGRTLPWPRVLGIWTVICGSSVCSVWCLQLNLSLCHWCDLSKCLKF